MTTGLTFAFALLAAAANLQAAKPEVTGFYPAGGQVGQTVEVEVIGKPGTAPVHVWCDRDGISAEASKDGKKLKITIPAEAEPGIAWLRVWNNEGSSGLEPFVIGRLPEVLEKESNETLAEAQEVDASGTVVNGRLHRTGQLDTFKVSLKKDETLVADVIAAEVLSSPMDAILQIASAQGFVLQQADDSPKLDPRLVFTAPEDGEYFVRIFAFPSDPNSSIRYAGGSNYIYRLTLTTGPYVRHAFPLTAGPGDKSLKAQGWNLPEDRAEIPMVSEEENVVPRIEFPAAVPMPISATDHPSYLESELDKKPFAPPFSLTGTIAEPDEVDRYLVSAKKGQTLKIRVQSASLGFPLDPILDIRDAKGKSLKAEDDSSRGEADIDEDWKVPADGEYEIVISDRFQHGGWDYAYLLTVEPPKPSARLSVESDAFTLTKDKALEIPVRVEKQNGLKEDPKLEVSGLPEGFTVEVGEGKSSEESGRRRRSRGGNSETVNVKISTKSDEPFHGPISITAKVGDKTISLNTPAAGATAKARHVWISYQPKK